ncbi:MAG: rRNA maturation RNAse YbeY [Acidimicrobiia bacterium]
MLHLLDYDHAEAEEATVMRRRERELLERFHDLEGNR